jgi:hypothetical protein
VTPEARRRLSSRWTVVHKFVFPAGWIAIFATATVLLFMAPAGGGDVQRTRWFLAVVTVVGGWMILAMTLPLKQVELGPRSFFVSNFSREIEIPFGDVARVSRSRWVNPPRATLHLRRAGEFGDAIVFVLPPRWGRGVHPVVRELEQLVGGRPDDRIAP